jgi:hypothetical protein
MGLGFVTIATSALTGAGILALVGFCAVVLLFITGGEKFFDRFRGGSFYTVWCIFAGGIGILVVQMLMRR